MKNSRFYQGFSSFMILFALICLMGASVITGNTVKAASNVAVTEIDYENLTLTLNPNGNAIIYYSTNKSTWNEIESCDGPEGTKIIDIAWTSTTSDTKLYFKGNEATGVVMVTLPKIETKLKASFNAKEGTVTLSDYGDATEFFWRKSTDYNWKKVSIDESSDSYKSFIKELENFRVMGATIYIRTAQIKGNGNQTGCRPSKEVKVVIKKRSSMPSVTLNIKKMTFNTTVKMEYRVANADKNGKWKVCDKTMKLRDITTAPFDDKATAVTIEFRRAATDRTPASKTKSISIPVQRAAPTDATVQSYYQTSGSGNSAKKSFVFNVKDAASDKPYEYVLVKKGDTFDESKASWKTLKNDKVKKFSQKSAPEGSVLYVRYKGVAENAKKNIKLELPSAPMKVTVAYGETK